VRPKYSLAQLLVAVTIWSVCIGAIVTFLPGWCYVLVTIPAAIALGLVVAKQSAIIAAFSSFPVICLLNWGSFHIAIEYAFGEPGIVSRVFGPVAYVLSWPMGEAQNVVPFTRPWDTAFGVVTVSLLETSAIFLIVALRRRYAGQVSTSDKAARSAGN
jgi:hypothetical protein